ncbi:cytochrome-c peroxidase [Arcobacter sp. FWKO B]|uniref:cytochrome-c peroxidase n=1 Tax=Arcobacter sp. FWKO B TaxID=2593672 RepID=UPI0018A51EAB|nr:cytochrome-c peroxidase [Arcobacter sp. FWKO B]QOG11422.1 cytochrome-c peroxidase [Arcobacter sp. FWKO B]
MKFFLTIILLSSTFVLAEPITPIPTNIENIDKNKVKLGSKLFFDPILSKDGTVSCATCHDLNAGGVDGLQFSIGIDGKVGDINSPTVFNAVYNFTQFWNGRARNLQEQAVGPIENHIEMGNTFENLIATLSNTPYKKDFEKIYSDGITKNNITDALAEFGKTLITPNAPFDKYLKGDEYALTKSQKEGYELFKSHGCIACHHGINIGGNLYAKFGVMKDVKSKSLGRYEVTKNELDKYYFKVPTLRNIELTSPYLHDGRITELEEVVKFMSHFQLGKTLTDSDISKIVDFLKSLTGELIRYDQ